MRAGSRGYYLKNEAVLLNQALINFALQVELRSAARGLPVGAPTSSGGCCRAWDGARAGASCIFHTAMTQTRQGLKGLKWPGHEAGASFGSKQQTWHNLNQKALHLPLNRHWPLTALRLPVLQPPALPCPCSLRGETGTSRCRRRSSCRRASWLSARSCRSSMMNCTRSRVSKGLDYTLRGGPGFL